MGIKERYKEAGTNDITDDRREQLVCVYSWPHSWAACCQPCHLHVNSSRNFYIIFSNNCLFSKCLISCFWINTVKDKAVPLHAMKVPGGGEVQLLLFLNLGTRR
jgi:hypothetical protein